MIESAQGAETRRGKALEIKQQSRCCPESSWLPGVGVGGPWRALSCGGTRPYLHLGRFLWLERGEQAQGA